MRGAPAAPPARRSSRWRGGCRGGRGEVRRRITAAPHRPHSQAPPAAARRPARAPTGWIARGRSWSRGRCRWERPGGRPRRSDRCGHAAVRLGRGSQAGGGLGGSSSLVDRSVYGPVYGLPPRSTKWAFSWRPLSAPTRVSVGGASSYLCAVPRPTDQPLTTLSASKHDRPTDQRAVVGDFGWQLSKNPRRCNATDEPHSQPHCRNNEPLQ